MKERGPSSRRAGLRRGAALLAATLAPLAGACAGIVGVSDLQFGDGGPGDDGATSGEAGGRADGGPGSDAPARGDGTASADAPGSGDATGTDDAPGAPDAPPSTTPRPLAPLSTSRVTSKRPTLRWVLPAGVSGATVDLCQDRACATVISTAYAAGSSYAPAADLPTGVVYWRLHPATDTSLTGPTWQMTVGSRTSPTDTSWGTTLDVEGDGFADVAVGAYVAERVYVYAGAKSGLKSTAFTAITTPAGASGESFGISVASAGDVNGDGFSDLVVGATAASGVAFVYFGGPTGLSTTPDNTLIGPVGANGIYGGAVAGVGDVNGDGYADVLIGNSTIAGNTGAAYLYLGGAQGLPAKPDVTLTGPAGGGGNFAGALAGAGDLNADGYADVIVGAHTASAAAGAAYVYMGSHAGIPTAPSLTLTAPAPQGNFGISVAGAGDLDGDGYGDVVVGASAVSSSAGAAYVYAGGSSGLVNVPTVTLTGSEGMNGEYGYSVAGAGDVNGDGYADLLVGAYGVTDDTGSAYVHFGGGKSVSDSAAALSGPDGANTEFGYAVSGGGDIQGNGYAHVVVGAFGGFDAPSTYAGVVHDFTGASGGITTVPGVSLTGPDGAGSFFGYSLFGATN